MELQLFQQSNRKKRGLANIIGRGIKFITGNMDDEDAEKITKRINELELNQGKIEEYSNDLKDIDIRIKTGLIIDRNSNLLFFTVQSRPWTLHPFSTPSSFTLHHVWESETVGNRPLEK